MTLRTILEIYFGINLFIAGGYWYIETDGKKYKMAGEIIPVAILIVLGSLFWVWANIEYAYILVLKRRKNKNKQS